MSFEEFLGGFRVLWPSTANLRTPPPLWMFLTPSLSKYVCYVTCVEKIITGGCGIWHPNFIVQEVIAVDELEEGNKSAAAGK